MICRYGIRARAPSKRLEMEGMEPLDRKEAAQHLVKLAFHVTALAKLFDPSIKTAKAAKASSNKDAGDKADKPKREPTAYTLYIKDQMPAFKEQARAWHSRARNRPFARRGACLAGRARACGRPPRPREPRRSGRRTGLLSRRGVMLAALPRVRNPGF